MVAEPPFPAPLTAVNKSTSLIETSAGRLKSITETSRDDDEYCLELGNKYRHQLQRRDRRSRFRLVCSRPIHHQRDQWDGGHRDPVQPSDLYAAAHDASDLHLSNIVAKDASA